MLACISVMRSRELILPGRMVAAKLRVWPVFEGAIEVFGGSGHRSIPRAYMRKLMHIQCSKTCVSQRSDGFEHGALRIGFVQEAHVPSDMEGNTFVS
jgi:hypothetical protein